MLVLNNCVRSETIVEFGSGDGSPVIEALLKTKFHGVVHGFELDNIAAKTAASKIKQAKLINKYRIYNSSFFDYANPEADYLISNPPYLPALDNNIYKPLLHGGTDGSEIAQKLLSLDYENVMLLVSSYSNPKGLIDFAKDKGYGVTNFMVSPLRFGEYSSEPKVKRRIAELRDNNMAFYSKNIYMLAGVLFKKLHNKYTVDLSQEFTQVMTSL